GDVDAAGGEVVEGQVVHGGDGIDVLAGDGAALVVAGGGGDIAGAGHGFHDDGHRVLAHAVDVGHGNAVLFEDLDDVGLALQFREGQDIALAVAADMDMEDLAVAVDIDEPRRPPADLALHGNHLAAGQALDAGAQFVFVADGGFDIECWG